MASFRINETPVGADAPCYIIAEMSANHGGQLSVAIDLLHAAKEAGANAVKLQTYRPDTITLKSDRPDFRLPASNAWSEFNTLYDLYQTAFMPWEWHDALFDCARSLQLDLFSSPFDHTAVDLLSSFDAPAYKIASPEITDIPLIKRVAQTGKPVILSTGMATLEDIQLAVETLRSQGCHDYAILKCTSAYPTPFDECNLRTITDYSERFQCVPGLSDHTEGAISPIVAVTLGAKIIEKHFIVDKSQSSVDDFFSMTAKEFKQMVQDVRNAEAALGNISYEITDSAKQNLLARRSLYFSEAMVAGQVITPDTIKSVRPGFGLHPKHYEKIIGKRVKQAVELGDRVTTSVIDGDIGD